MTGEPNDRQRYVCARCGYDLTRPSSRVCPECGSAVADVRTARDVKLERLSLVASWLVILGLVLTVGPALVDYRVLGWAEAWLTLAYLLAAAVLGLLPIGGPGRTIRLFTRVCTLSAGYLVAMGLTMLVKSLIGQSFAAIPAAVLLGVAVLVWRQQRKFMARARWLYPALRRDGLAGEPA